MSDYSREQIENALRKATHSAKDQHYVFSEDNFFEHLDRPEFVKKSGVIFCSREKSMAADQWGVSIARAYNLNLNKCFEYRRPNPLELGLAMKFVKCVHADIKAETRYWEGYDRAIDHCNKLMGWDSDE
jgi:hypothetical protein